MLTVLENNEEEERVQVCRNDTKRNHSIDQRLQHPATYVHGMPRATHYLNLILNSSTLTPATKICLVLRLFSTYTC